MAELLNTFSVEQNTNQFLQQKKRPHIQIKIDVLNVFPPTFSRALTGWFNWGSHVEMARRNQT